MFSDYTMGLRFSIVVPTRNRAASLDRCLTALGALDYARDEYEVFVVDDGSQPSVDSVCKRHSSRIHLQYIRTEGVGPARARNTALRLATGDYVAFTDDDCQPAPRWLRAFDAAIEGDPKTRRAPTAFGGRIVDSPENGICGRASQMLVSFLYEYNERPGGLRFFCSNNLAFPRPELLGMGGFDESFPLAAAEDRYICALWSQLGRLQFVPDAVVEHRQMLDLRGFVRQQFRYGQGACQFWRRRLADENKANRLEPGNFYRRMLQYPFGRVSFGAACIMSLLLVISQAAVAVGYYREKFITRRIVPRSAGPESNHPDESRAVR